MHVLLLLLSLLALVGGLVCGIIVLVDAFNDEIWKGLVSLFCGLYLLYYGIFEFEHDYKWPIVLGMVGGGAISAGILRLG